MKTLEQEMLKKNRGNTGNFGSTLEAKIGDWYRPPVLKTTLTEELAKQIAECFLDGLTDEETAIQCDVATYTVKNWRNLSPIRNHEISRKRFYIEQIRDGKRRDWTRLAWWLERRYPLEFSRPEVAHAISTSIHTSVNTTQNLIVSSELAEQLLERNAKISTKIDELFSNRPLSHNIKDVMCYNEELSASAREVKSVVDNITSTTNVIDSDKLVTNVDQSSPNNPPFLHPGGVTPSAPPDSPTVSPSPTGGQKAGKKLVKGFQVIPDIVGDSEKLAAITRKNFDKMATMKKSAENKKSVEPLELEGQVIKERTRSIMGENEKRESRATMIAELERSRKATKVDRAALRAANKAADKIHPRKARGIK